MRKKLPLKFFKRPTLQVAEDLVGKFLIRKIKKQRFELMITETEAYCGFHDKASHASRGMTERNKIMFESAGSYYIYLIYGMYYCLNIVTEKKDYPAAVLIRAGILKNNSDKKACGGPGKICRELQIDKRFNAQKVNNPFLYLEEQGLCIKKKHIKKTPRIGVDYAMEYKEKPWRFVLAD